MLHYHANDQKIKKLRSQSANILTLTNLCLGAFAILVSINNQLYLCVLLIFLAALTDRFDGLVARKLNIVSDLGKQLDSMSDIISFGIAPALLIYQGILHTLDFPGVFFTVFYIGCGAFRLARFNTSDSRGFFIGLPITAAGCLLSLSFLFVSVLPTYLYIFISLTLSIMMIATIKLKKI